MAGSGCPPGACPCALRMGRRGRPAACLALSLREAESRLAKMSVTELRKLLAAGLAGDDAGEAPWFKTLPLLGLRPRFLGKAA